MSHPPQTIARDHRAPSERRNLRFDWSRSAVAIGVWVLGACGCPPSIYETLHPGERLQITVVELKSAGALNQPSCMDLPDLPAGTVVVADVAAFDAAPAGCGVFGAELTPMSISSGTIHERTIDLPSGCSGRFFLTLEAPSSSEAGTGAANASRWSLLRSFGANDPALCWPGVPNAPNLCHDKFFVDYSRL